ncbi:MAG TPA: LysR family transcriptional regulator [Roseiarcus sp.]|nr:LysR family transcriptional regulator [Roseiarcus sp.]
MRSLPIDVLRAFVAVVETGGFTRAAEELGRSQPTVSLQVKRLEELLDASLFEKGTRLELTGVGAVCFDYGKRLLRLHDDLLDEVSRRNSPGSALRVGMPSELVQLTPRLGRLRDATRPGASIEVITGASESLSAAFSQKALDIAFVIGRGAEANAAMQWPMRLRWYGGNLLPRAAEWPLPLAVPPPKSVLHEAAVAALREHKLRFNVVFTSADCTALAAAAYAGLGVTPLIEGLAPDGIQPCADESLPPLPPVTLSLVARSKVLIEAGRQWAAEVMETLQPR